MNTKRLIVLVAALGLCHQAVLGDELQRRGPSKARGKAASSQPAKSPQIAIVGGDVYTVTREVIRGGTVLVQDGKIVEVGQNLTVPEGATVIDAKGKYVTPGFVSINMSGVGLGSTRSSSGSSRNSSYADSLDPYDRNLKLALGIGITSGCVQVQSRSGRFRRRSPDERFLGLEPEELFDESFDHEDHNPDFGDHETETCKCCGLPILPTEPITPTRPSPVTPRRHVVLKMSYGELDPMLVKESAFFDLTASSLTGPLNRFNWRQNIKKARKYLKDQAAHEKAAKSGSKSRPPRKPVSDDFIRLVNKEVSLRTRADSVDEIRDMVALARELDYELVLDGVAEGWLISAELSEADVPVVITPRNRRRAEKGREDSSGSSIEASRIFEEAGVPFAVAPLRSSISLNGLAGRDLTSLPLEAAFAVRGGCAEKTALAALTIVPAQLMGLADRLGSIEPGKDADLLILNGPPLDYRTYVESAMVSGRVCYVRSKDLVYPVFERP